MVNEKRRYERIVIPGDIIINHPDYTVKCRIENISNYGAYLKVEDSRLPPSLEMGNNVTFSISTPNIAARELSGQILRCTMENQAIYLAVYFIQPYIFD